MLRHYQLEIAQLRAELSRPQHPQPEPGTAGTNSNTVQTELAEPPVSGGAQTDAPEPSGMETETPAAAHEDDGSQHVQDEEPVVHELPAEIRAQASSSCRAPDCAKHQLALRLQADCRLPVQLPTGQAIDIM